MAETKYFIGKNLLGDIRHTIHRVSSIPVSSGSAGPAFDTLGTNREPQVFRVGTATGSWTKGDAKTVTWAPGAGVTTTLTALNLFANISAATATAAYNCAVARVGDSWLLIAAECQ